MNNTNRLEPYILRSYNKYGAEIYYLIPEGDHEAWCQVANDYYEWEKAMRKSSDNDKDYDPDIMHEHYSNLFEEIGTRVYEDQFYRIWTTPKDLRQQDQEFKDACLKANNKFYPSANLTKDQAKEIYGLAKEMSSFYEEDSNGGIYIGGGVWVYADGDVKYD